MGEERMQEVLVLALFGDGRIESLLKVVEMVRDEVRQISVLCVAPALLDGV